MMRRFRVVSEEPEMRETPPQQTMSSRVQIRQLFAACIGSVLEFYDFVVYAFLATTIAARFFPSANEVASLLASFAAFGVGFLARPVGGLVIGRIGDIKGRKVALLVSIFGMALGTVGIGLLPSFESIGTLAPILLVILRLLQGLAAGGEWGGATAFVTESAPNGRRGWYGSICQASIASSILLGSLVVALVTAIFSPQEMQAWAWRVPFLLGGILLPIGFYLRRNMAETPVFVSAHTQAAERDFGPSQHPLGTQFGMLSKCFGLTAIWTVSFYVLITYMPTFVTKHVGLSSSQALWSNSSALVVLVIVTPLFGLLSDSIGRRPLLLGAWVGLIVLPYPLFSLILSHPSFTTVVAVQIVFNLFIAAFSGAAPAALAELFPTRSRTTLMSSSYSLSTAIFGGFAPFVATWLIDPTGSAVSPVYYIVIAAIVSAPVIWGLRETAHEGLR